MHNLLFNLQTSGLEPNFLPMENALTNWKRVWDRIPPTQHLVEQQLPGSMWLSLGFMRHAPEFWQLASIVLDRIRLLQTVKGDEVEASVGIMQSYDEIDMSQLNGLIAEFKTMRVGSI